VTFTAGQADDNLKGRGTPWGVAGKGWGPDSAGFLGWFWGWASTRAVYVWLWLWLLVSGVLGRRG